MKEWEVAGGRMKGFYGMLIFLSCRWPVVDGVLFGVMMFACGMAGAAALLPFSYWMVRRGFDVWPGGAVKGGDLEAPVTEMIMPTLRQAWAPLLLALALLITLFGLLVRVLS